MHFYADLHIHSKYSRATSKNCDLENLSLWAQKKGIALIATGDFTHPAWFAEIAEKLVPAEPGLFRLKPDIEKDVRSLLGGAPALATRFMLEVEISTIYKKGDKVRKIHHLLYAPSLEAAGKIRNSLDKIGNINADGRPILGLDSRDLLEITLESDEFSYLIPAHIWTPWFAVLGSKGGFDSIDECYADLAEHIFAIETGLSSDPAMNWRLSALDRYRIVSNSDAHSPAKLGREATVFTTELSYFSVLEALKTGEGFGGTMEFFPEEGKYHLDGHRKCNIRFTPKETTKHDGLCPECGGKLTVGVLSRVEELADRGEEEKPEDTDDFKSIVPLPEIVSEIEGKGVASKAVQGTYEMLIQKLGAEFSILEEVPTEDIRRRGFPALAEAIENMRAGKANCEPGFDGEYGRISLLERPAAKNKGNLALIPEGPNQGKKSSLRAKVAVEKNNKLDSATSRKFRRNLLCEDVRQRDLNPSQKAAVEHRGSPLLIVAGPGTGKTRTLTKRIAHLIEHESVAAKNCLAITFTRRAAAEMKERLESLLADKASEVSLMTFHSLGMHIATKEHSRLGLPSNLRLVSDLEKAQILTSEKKYSEKKVQSLLEKISLSKRNALEKELTDEEHSAGKRYREYLKEKGLLDFDDLLLLPLELFARERDLVLKYRELFSWIFVDEYQDIDILQYRLLKFLCPPDGNICAIGDPDQAIYSFRGSDHGFFMRFKEDFPNTTSIQLEQNYRSSECILTASSQVIAESSLLEGPTLLASFANEENIAIHRAASEDAEAEFVVHKIEQLVGGTGFFSIDSGRISSGIDSERDELSFSDFAVLYRTNSQSKALATAFARSGIPFQICSQDNLLAHPGILRLIRQMAELEEQESIAKRLEKAFELENCQTTDSPSEWELSRARELLKPLAKQCAGSWEEFLKQVSLSTEIDLWDPRAERVSLLSLHAAKGMEFKVVFLVGCEDGIIPLRWGAGDKVDLAEERRLLYVGMTRAQERLFLSQAKKRFWRGKVREMEVSPFLKAIEEELIERQQTILSGSHKREKNEQLSFF